MKPVAVLITCPNRKEAEKIAEELVRRKKAACVNIVPGVRSLFRWKGKIDSEDELLLVAKTDLRLFEQVARLVKKLHSYDVPEILAVPIVRGSEDYLKWVKDNINI